MIPTWFKLRIPLLSLSTIISHWLNLLVMLRAKRFIVFGKTSRHCFLLDGNLSNPEVLMSLLQTEIKIIKQFVIQLVAPLITAKFQSGTNLRKFCYNFQSCEKWKKFYIIGSWTRLRIVCRVRDTLVAEDVLATADYEGGAFRWLNGTNVAKDPRRVMLQRWLLLASHGNRSKDFISNCRDAKK